MNIQFVTSLHSPNISRWLIEWCTSWSTLPQSSDRLTTIHQYASSIVTPFPPFLTCGTLRVNCLHETRWSGTRRRRRRKRNERTTLVLILSRCAPAYVRTYSRAHGGKSRFQIHFGWSESELSLLCKHIFPRDLGVQGVPNLQNESRTSISSYKTRRAPMGRPKLLASNEWYPHLSCHLASILARMTPDCS